MHLLVKQEKRTPFI